MTTQTKATHTVGPWRETHGPHPMGHALYITGHDAVRSVVCEIRQYPEAARAESEANARLIAAAPELLAALKAMLASYDGLRDVVTSPVVLNKLAQAEAAIAKAEAV